MEDNLVTENGFHNCDKHRRLSIFISLILRHKPEVIGIEVDSHGWVDVNELINRINRSERNNWHITHQILDGIVEGDEKQRYRYNSDKSKIRANQGHSIPVDVELKLMSPPHILYHGTSDKYLSIIAEEGLKPMSRLYVHLSCDKETAYKVGARHGKPAVLSVRAVDMFNVGTPFYLSENGVWLVKSVPLKYLYMSIEDVITHSER